MNKYPTVHDTITSDGVPEEFKNFNLANMKEVTVTLWDSPEDIYPTPTFQGTLIDFIKHNDNLEFDEMNAIDHLRVNDLVFLSSGQGYMVLRRDS